MVLRCLADSKCWSPSNNTIGLFWSSYHVLRQKKALFCTSAQVHYCCPPTKHAPASGSVYFLPHLPATLFLYWSSLQLLDMGHFAHTFGSSTSRLESAVWELLYHPILSQMPRLHTSWICGIYVLNSKCLLVSSRYCKRLYIPQRYIPGT